MNGDEIQQVKEAVCGVMNTHVLYIRQTLSDHKDTLNTMQEEITKTRIEVAKLRIVGMRRATWVSAAVSGVITSVANVLMWRWRG